MRIPAWKSYQCPLLRICLGIHDWTGIYSRDEFQGIALHQTWLLNWSWVQPCWTEINPPHPLTPAAAVIDIMSFLANASLIGLCMPGVLEQLLGTGKIFFSTKIVYFWWQKREWGRGGIFCNLIAFNPLKINLGLVVLSFWNKLLMCEHSSLIGITDIWETPALFPNAIKTEDLMVLWFKVPFPLWIPSV